MNSHKSDFDMNAHAARVRRWILPLKKDTGLNLMVLTVTVGAVTTFVALFAAQL